LPFERGRRPDEEVRHDSGFRTARGGIQGVSKAAQPYREGASRRDGSDAGNCTFQLAWAYIMARGFPEDFDEAEKLFREYIKAAATVTEVWLTSTEENTREESRQVGLWLRDRPAGTRRPKQACTRRSFRI
jgi:hypothetical protein